MRSKLVILSLMLAAFATVATAQTKSRYYAESAKDNYFISLGVGAQLCVDPNASENGVTPLFNLSVGKLINPVWGVRGMVSGINTKLYSYIDAEGYTDANAGRELDKNYFTVRVDGLFNISNAIAGYSPDRKFEFYGFMGPALQFAIAEVGGDSDLKALINGSVGLGAAYNINKNWALNLEVRGEVSESPFGDYSSTIANGFVGGTFGATYYFGGKKFVKVTNEALLVAANGDIQKYKELLAAEQANLAAVKDELAKEKAKAPVEVVKEIETIVAGPRAVFFTIGKSNIDAKGMVNINLAADIMKANPDVKYVVNGYADKATGTPAVNLKISERRASIVKERLVALGVSSERIVVDFKGDTVQPFAENDKNRVIIYTLK